VSNKDQASLVDAFERALEIILARVSVLSPLVDLPEQKRPRTIAVAYSGGLDSSALLYLTHRYALRHGIALFAFHIHHGISPNADRWLSHCERECARLDIRIDVRRVLLADRNRNGVEQAARISRYAALGELCRLHQVPMLLTAHHLDDQAETVLLQMLRGSGVAGLGGMEQANTAPGLLGDRDLIVARPLLDVSRIELEQFVATEEIAYVDDESNGDPRYARNALRYKVLPSFEEYFPGFQQRLARTARHAQAAQRLLDELAAQDLAACRDGECIAVEPLAQLSVDRIDNVLRYWFASRGMRMPAAAWLGEMRQQILEARDDAQLCVKHPDCEVHRHRGRIFLVPRSEDTAPHLPPLKFRWHGETRVHFPAYGGSVLFNEAPEGIDADWLMTQDLVIQARGGGEKLKLAPNRPSRSLKHHYQALGIPSWERAHLPVIVAAGQLLFAAGVGMNWRGLRCDGSRHVTLSWEHD
jgi:tRNA(Ile)-lysidine synthase